MNASDNSFVLPGKDGPEVWRSSGSAGPARHESGKARNADWIALPMRSVVSVPMRFSGLTAERRESAALLDLEGLGLSASETDFQIETSDGEQREQRAWTVVQSTQLPPQAVSASMDAKFAPSVSFRTLKRGEVQLWDEAGHLAVAIPDETGQPLHAQALTAITPDEDAAAELRCILAALDLAGMAPEVNQVILQQQPDAAMPAEALAPFAAGLSFPVATESVGQPHLPRKPWRLLPPAIVQRRVQRRQQQSMMLAGAGFLLVLVALLGAFAGRLWTRERTLAAETARLNALEPQLQVIREAQQRWNVLEHAISPDKFAMEMFHQVSQLLPPDGIRLENFEMREGHLILDGTASNPQLTGQLREDLQRVPAFASLQWDFPNASINPDGTARFHADGAPPTGDEAPKL